MEHQKNVYLSVDMDYWYKPKNNSLSYIKKLLKLNRPVTVFTEHQLVLREIKRQYKKVYNIDFHSDISNREPGWPNCGNWVNYVYGRDNAEFEWRMPNWNICITEGWGLCHETYVEHSEYNPFLDSDSHSWKGIDRKQGLSNIPLHNVDRISLVLSPEWSHGDYIADALIHLIECEGAGQIKFYGRNVKPLIKKMLRKGEPFGG